MPEHSPAPSPARSIYGFFLYLLTKTILVVYIAWALVPESYLNYFNIYYYPQKYWAVAVPIEFFVGTSLFLFVVYPGLNLMLTPRIDSINTITDSYSNKQVKNDIEQQDVQNNVPSDAKCVCKDKRKCYKWEYDLKPQSVKDHSIPYAHDLDISSVCRKLYLKPASHAGTR